MDLLPRVGGRMGGPHADVEPGPETVDEVRLHPEGVGVAPNSEPGDAVGVFKDVVLPEAVEEWTHRGANVH